MSTHIGRLLSLLGQARIARHISVADLRHLSALLDWRHCA
jgi:UDP-3-O-[3-hydroxymyristoyl] glucosamine N-acyltransferase